MSDAIRNCFGQAAACCRSGHVAEAAQHLRAAQKLAPGSARISYTAGLLDWLTGGQAARRELEEISAATPGLLPVVPLQGLSGRIVELTAESPANLTLQLTAAEAELSDGKEQEAKRRFIHIVRASRRNQDYPNLPIEGLSEPAVRAMVGGQPIWHSIDLGGSLWIEGLRKTARISAREVIQLDFPELTGKSVLDVGAFGGFFSFEAERRGASVTALEYYSWVTNYPKLHEWANAQHAAGRSRNAYEAPDYTLDLVNQPGRRAFDVTRFITNGSVRPVCGLLENVAAGEIGVHDIVLYMGVLYHTKDPFGALRALRAVTREKAIVETLAVHIPGAEDRATWEYYGDDSTNNDASTWWAPNETGLRDMLIAAGFRQVEIKIGADAVVESSGHRKPYRLIAHALS
jgi:tRNA (mo5U34)-methyltransferase